MIHRARPIRRPRSLRDNECSTVAHALSIHCLLLNPCFRCGVWYRDKERNLRESVYVVAGVVDLEMINLDIPPIRYLGRVVLSECIELVKHQTSSANQCGANGRAK